MRLRILLATTLFASALIGVVPAVSAQGVMIDEGGVRIVPPQGRGYDRYDRQDRQDSYDRGIGPRDARRIARGAGMADVNSVGRRGRAWIVDGEDYRGRDIRVTISARSGEVMDVQRYRR